MFLKGAIKDINYCRLNIHSFIQGYIQAENLKLRDDIDPARLSLVEI